MPRLATDEVNLPLLHCNKLFIKPIFNKVT